MQARDVMTGTVVTVRPETPVREIARLLLEHRVSAVPVTDAAGTLLGIVSEGDLMRRAETGTERPSSWWLSLLSSPEDEALAFVKSHGGRAEDVMTRDLVTVADDTPLEEVAAVLERRRIKRVPVLHAGRLAGILSRADLLRGLVARQLAPAATADDRTLKAAVEAKLRDAGVRPAFVSVLVTDGVVQLWGAVSSEAERRAAKVAAEEVPGVRGVRSEVGVLPRNIRSVLWAE